MAMMVDFWKSWKIYSPPIANNSGTMPARKCREKDVLEVLRRSLREGRTITKDELVKELVRRCGYRSVSGAYKLVNKLEQKEVLKYVPGHGYRYNEYYIGEGHGKIIMRTLAALLDMVGAHGFSFEALRKSLGEKYGYDISKHVVERLAVEALLHVITSMEDLAGELEEVTELVERFEKLLKQWDDLQSRLEDLGVMNKGEKHYMFSDVMKQIAYVLELKQGEDARQYYEPVKKLIDRIAGESNIEEACYREVERFKEREILRRLCEKIDRLDIVAPTLSTMLRRAEIASKVRELKGELEKAAEALNKFYEKMVDAITTYQIEVMTTGSLAGRCRICGGRSDEKLLSLASSLKKWLEWLEKRKPREILNLLERPGSGGEQREEISSKDSPQ